MSVASAAVLSDEARAFLEEVRFGVLATIDPDGTPQLTVMWYELRDGVIVMNTAAGRRKERNISRDPRAALLVEDGYRWVRVRGRIERVTDRATAQEDIRRLAVRYLGPRPGAQAAREFADQERITYRLRIEAVRSWSSE